MSGNDDMEEFLQRIVDNLYGPGHILAEVLERPTVAHMMEAIQRARVSSDPNEREVLATEFRKALSQT